LEEYGISTHYDESYSDSYYPKIKLIEIDSKQSKESQLCGMLHEASHVILNHVIDNTTEHCDIIRMESEAWEYGVHIAESLGFEINVENYHTYKKESLKNYKEN